MSGMRLSTARTICSYLPRPQENKGIQLHLTVHEHVTAFPGMASAVRLWRRMQCNVECWVKCKCICSRPLETHMSQPQPATRPPTHLPRGRRSPEPTVLQKHLHDQ
jgi:hypothetical protein